MTLNPSQEGVGQRKREERVVVEDNNQQKKKKKVLMTAIGVSFSMPSVVTRVCVCV